jgi:mannose-1-phosphate guanylyltransferase
VTGRESLVAQTLVRARSVVGRERVTAIVSEAHAQYWHMSLAEVASHNVFVQPANRGTAVGILLPALDILDRDPDARILILPSDHYVADEAALAIAMRVALDDIGCHGRGVALLGIEADEPDPELGYIVPEPVEHPTFAAVRRFVEKPPIEEARRLCEHGALWNSFIIACRGASLLELYVERFPDVVEKLRGVDRSDLATLSLLYRSLPPVDFSRDLATGQEERLSVIRVPHCGWNDLGTPQRLAQTLARHPTLLAHALQSPFEQATYHVNLPERLLRSCFGGQARLPAWFCHTTAHRSAPCKSCTRRHRR